MIRKNKYEYGDYMNPEEQANREVFWVMQKIKKESLKTLKDGKIVFNTKVNDSMDAPILSRETQLSILIFLESKNLIRLYYKIFSEFGDYDTLEEQGAPIIGYLLEITQPKFFVTYKKFDKLFDCISSANTNQLKNTQNRIDYDKKRGVLSLDSKAMYSPHRTKGRKQILDDLWITRSRPKTNLLGSWNPKEVLALKAGFLKTNEKFGYKHAKSVDEAISDFRDVFKNYKAPAHIEGNRGYMLVIED
jgi:hypothetical protein